MSTSKLFGKDILITSTTEATSNTVGAFSTLGGINVTKTILTAGGINSISNTNTLGNLFTTGGNIGIGTTAPTQALSIEGNFNFTGSLFQNGSVYNGSTQWGSTGANIYYNTGSVGLGTLAPVGRLHMANPTTLNTNNVVFEVGTTVDGANSGWSALNFNGYYNGSETRINTSKNRWRLSMDQRSTTDRLYFDTYNGTTLTTIMSLNSNGNVGIGNNTATRLLQVGNLNGNTQGTISISNTGEARYHLYNGGAVTEWVMGQRSSTQHNFNISRVVANVEADLFTITSAGNVGIGTTSPTTAKLVISGSNGARGLDLSSTDQYAEMRVIRNSLSSLDKDMWLQIGAGSGSKLRLYSNNTETMVLNNGNVGIGTSSPSYTLDVNGSNNTIQVAGINNTIYVPNCVFTNNSTVGGTAVSSFLSPNMPVNSSNTCVYVGRSLSVGNSTSIIYNYTGSNNTANSISFNHYGLGGGMYLLNNGNLGISTTNPLYTLDVRGTLRSTGDIFIGDGSGAEAIHLWDIPGAAWRLTTGDYNLSIQNGTIGSTMNTRVIMTSSGNVGIGITSPTERLSVDGSIRLGGSTSDSNTDYYIKSAGQITISANDAATQDGSFTYLGLTAGVAPNMSRIDMGGSSTGSDNHIRFSTLNTERMRIGTSGNVGIGTTAPGTVLHISRSGTTDTIPSTGLSGSTVFSFMTSETLGYPGYGLLGGVMSSTGAAWLQSKYSGNSTNLPLLIQPLGGNVGIGTTNPSALLDVANGGDNTGAGGGPQISLQYRSSSGGGFRHFIRSRHHAISSNDSGNGIDFFLNNVNTATGSSTPGTGNVCTLSVTGSGVGIGTTFPSAPLHVTPTSNISPANNGIYCYNPTNSANQHAIVSVRTAGAASGNPYISWDINTVTGWSMGIDNADGDKFKISNAWDSLSSATKMTFSGNNVGIMTTAPAYTLDVNGTIARSGVRLPRFDNGSFSGATSFSIPILFNDTNYNYCEIKVRYVVSTGCDINISATSYANAAMTFLENALTTVKWNAQGTPVYTTFTNVVSGLFANNIEQYGIDNNLIFRIIRASGTSISGARNHYSYDNVYCWAEVGTARGYGQGHIDNASVGGSPIQYITFTCSTGTVSGTYSTVHSY